ncbi:ABC transporter substrate-binding protein [Bradyrhizobium sp. U87765 SZCCT0131]|nr:ABC transporter substrate-binding protein [Bradyrhizobium sp. U87765 SZCCT0131]MBR1262728.1 ABC transporter substrate-binding protein [Bradyrhizobium sp. U87765 SZCCT0134]MBR1308800.1 ABC transporter substrate-binding protein [Bradyrhizobium sp. U87765 SZCCT0110]MBR1318510.1 ABC transporter substrate-binding protein [Bradyrhizobium sp. U87765 SZCCT0109]MBR1352214.1 ABC transporter substrate-binding protein [Bradyrhizobium sp. U87765 SZCCT0048]
MSMHLARRRVLGALPAATIAVVLATAGPSARAEDAHGVRPGLDPANPVVLTVGVPRNFGYLSTLWAKDVQVPGVRIEYKYFPNFIDMLTAFNGRQLDVTEIGDVGAAQSFAASKGGVRVIAVTQPNPENTGLLVAKDSPYKTFADLKGKQLLFLKSTNTYLGVKNQIAAAKLKEDDFRIVELAGPSAVKAFQTGQIEGYYTIDPNMADVVEKTGARLIATGTDMGIENLYPYVSHEKVIAEKKAALAAFVQALADTIAWAQAHPDEQARLVAPKVQFTESAIRETFRRGAKGLQIIDEGFHARQQRNLDALLAAGVLKQPVSAQNLYLTTFNASIAPSSAGANEAAASATR